jgi:hypothetical protein
MSSTYFQTNIISRINNAIKKVITKGPRKEPMINLVNFFTLYLQEISAMQVTKIAFSEEEMKAMLSADFFHIKHEAIRKIFELFGELEQRLRTEPSLKELQLENVETRSGKIFKGENYRKLPYVLLDYPRLFTADNVFSFRSMFWWGNEFSFTLHLQGQELEKFRFRIKKNIERVLGQGFYFCINKSPWEYVFTQDNYILLDELYENPEGFNPLISSKEFIKLSRRIPLKEYDNVINYGVETFKLALNLLK